MTLETRVDSYITLTSLNKEYDGKTVFFDASFKFPKGQITALMGPSGSGKTTIMKILLGLEDYQGNLIGYKSNASLSNSQVDVSVVFQDNRLLPWISVRKNVELVLKEKKNQSEVAIFAQEALDLVELGDAADLMPEELSGGMQRRVALARALAFDGDIILLDEPFTGLDEELKQRIASVVISRFKERGKTVILITHDSEEAAIYADHIIKL